MSPNSNDGWTSGAASGASTSSASRDRGAGGRFLAGNNGGGRPKGSRNRLSQSFLQVIAEDFSAHGADALKRVREADPGTYLKLVGSLVPRDLILQWEQAPKVDYADLELEEFTMLVEAEQRRKHLEYALRCIDERMTPKSLLDSALRDMASRKPSAEPEG